MEPSCSREGQEILRAPHKGNLGPHFRLRSGRSNHAGLDGVGLGTALRYRVDDVVGVSSPDREASLRNGRGGKSLGAQLHDRQPVTCIEGVFNGKAPTVRARRDPAGSTITVLLTREGSAVTLLVQDEGPGVSDEVARRAFDRFWRGGSSYEGSGLGLAIVKELADASGASVALETRENGGAQARAVFHT